MSQDPEIFIEIWKELKFKNNIALFIDSEDFENDCNIILGWFSKIIKTRIGVETAQIMNGTFLCIRKILNQMPPISSDTIGEYKLFLIDKEQMNIIKRCLNE